MKSVERDDGSAPDRDAADREQYSVKRRGRARVIGALQPQEDLARVAVGRLGALVAGGRAQPGGGQPFWSSASVSRVPR